MSEREASEITDTPEVGLPGAAGKVAREKPELWEAFQQLGTATAEAGPLDERTRRLVNLALAIGADSEGATHSHCRRALAEDSGYYRDRPLFRLLRRSDVVMTACPLTKETYHLISREELAHIYTRLIGKAEEAENDGAIVYDVLRPSSAMGNSQNFEHFIDYEEISPRYRGHVARAYRDEVLFRTFGLTPKSLVSLKGFHPGAPVTRLEALLFLETSFDDGDGN